MLRMVNQSRIKATRNAPRYKFGYCIPHNYSEAMQFDLKNGNTLWREATNLEMSQLAEYDTFRDLGHKDTAPPPTGYKKIRTHLVYDCKHDGRHKVWMVADGHLTDIPLESVYSGVVSLRGLRIITFLSELNGLDLWATNIGNAYLEAFTMEWNYIIAGPEFGQLEGHYLIIVKALYGLRTSGLRWHECFADCLCNEGFSPCKAEPDIWMRLNGDLYEYVATYVDDLCLGMLDPKSFTDTLQKKYNFKLKGMGPIDFHLGQSFSWNDDGEMEISAKCYVDKMIDTYVQLYGEKPRKASSPLEQNDHLEMDDSPFLRQDEMQQFQSLIGAMQWAVLIGRLDIATAVMSLSSFRAMPRRGHLEKAKQIYGYLQKMKEARIRVLTNEPDYSDYQDLEYDWSSSVYEDVKEIIPTDIPEPNGEVHYPVPLLRCKLVSQHGYWKIRYCHPPLPQSNPDGLVFEETSYGGDCYFWFRIHRCEDYYQSDCQPPNDSLLSRHSYSRKELRLWRQQDRYRRLVDPTCQATQETQCSIIPLCVRGSCIQVCYDLPSARRIQPCRHPQQALGLCFGMGNHECTPICSRRYMGSFR
jgi:hypothetical protein